MRRRLLFLVCAAFLVATTVTVLVPAEAATVSDAGWWDRNQGVTIGAPAPPPEGALRVANDPGGPSAVAAVRYALNPGEVQPVLTLRVTGDPVPAGGGFVACATDRAWTGESGGSFDDAPERLCDDAQSLGTVSEDGTTVRFDLSAMLEGVLVDAVIIPAPMAGDPVGDTFVTDFAAPIAPDMTTSPPPSVQTTSPPATEAPSRSGTPPPPSQSSGTPATVPPIRSTPATTTTTAFVPSDITTPPPTMPAFAPPTPPTGDEVAIGSVDEATGRNRIGAGLIALALVGLGGWWWSQESKKDDVGPEYGGLGKFVRQRSGPAADVS